MNDELVSIAHLLLNELECCRETLENVNDPFSGLLMDVAGNIEDADAVIEQAKKILSKYPV